MIEILLLCVAFVFSYSLALAGFFYLVRKKSRVKAGPTCPLPYKPDHPAPDPHPNENWDNYYKEGK